MLIKANLLSWFTYYPGGVAFTLAMWSQAGHGGGLYLRRGEEGKNEGGRRAKEYNLENSICQITRQFSFSTTFTL